MPHSYTLITVEPTLFCTSSVHADQNGCLECPTQVELGGACGLFVVLVLADWTI